MKLPAQQHPAYIASSVKQTPVGDLFANLHISEKVDQQMYGTIGTSRPSASTLHHDAKNFVNCQHPAPDAGYGSEHYAADITCTWPLASSQHSKEAQNIIELVERIQQACLERLVPGVRFLDLHIEAHQYVIKGLLELGILCKGTLEEIYKSGTSLIFFPHGLGQYVEFEVDGIDQIAAGCDRLQAASLYPENFHLPVYDEKLCRRPTHPKSPHLEKDDLVTVEPGIYFPPDAVYSKYIDTNVFKQYLPVGGYQARVNIRITSNGPETLIATRHQGPMLNVESHEKGTNILQEPRVPTPGFQTPVVAISWTSTTSFEKETTPNLQRVEDSSALQYHQPSWRLTQNSSNAKARENGKYTTLCSSSHISSAHIILAWETELRAQTSFPYPKVSVKRSAPKCRPCDILFEAIPRLSRQYADATQGHQLSQGLTQDSSNVKARENGKCTTLCSSSHISSAHIILAWETELRAQISFLFPEKNVEKIAPKCRPCGIIWGATLRLGKLIETIPNETPTLDTGGFATPGSIRPLPGTRDISAPSSTTLQAP